MPQLPLDRVLLTNDDGIDAPGLAILAEAAHTIAREVWIAAPETDQSGTSHSISLHHPLRIRKTGPRRFAVSGTPGDCAALGIRHLMADAPPDLVLSGINRGGNLGRETVFSGTVGAAMTAMLLGIPAIALSQAYRDGIVPWDTARTHAPAVLRQLLARSWPGDCCLNVNFPSIPAAACGPLAMTRQGRGVLDGIGTSSHTDPRGLGYHWLTLTRAPTDHAPGTESEALAQGRISVTPLQFERTHTDALDTLRTAHAT